MIAIQLQAEPASMAKKRTFSRVKGKNPTMLPLLRSMKTALLTNSATVQRTKTSSADPGLAPVGVTPPVPKIRTTGKRNQSGTSKANASSF